MDTLQDVTVVIKLALENQETLYKRVPWQQLLQQTSPIDSLKDHAVQFYLHSNQQSSLSNYRVSMTYKDTDEDTAVLTTNEELHDAITQYKDAKTLKVVAHVKPYEQPEHSELLPTRSVSSGSQTEPSRQTTSTQTKQHGKPPVHHVIEGVVAVLDATAAAIQIGTRAISNPSIHASPPCQGPPEANRNGGKNVKEVVPPEQPFIHARHTCDGCFKSPIFGKRFHATNKDNFDLCETCHNNYSGPVVFEDVQLDCDKQAQDHWRLVYQPSPQEPPAEEQTPAPSSTDRPFIHGRHTCDSCLATPIIGKRYHAKHRNDFDLCEKCYESYQGPDELEPQELDRDRPMQDRWHIRHARFVARKDRRCGGRRRCGPRHRPSAPYPPPPHCHPGPSSYESPCHRPFWASSPEPVVSSSEEPNYDDLALKEAIRRSLEEPEQSTESKVEEKESFDVEDSANEVADFISETLDRFASVIDEVTEELKRESPKHEQEAPALEVDIVVPSNEVQEDGWSVVSEEHYAVDSSFAHATQTIGSALYESELSRNQESGEEQDDKSKSSSGSSISAVSSVPTTVRTLTIDTPVPQALLDRWTYQLRQLHELGFHNEALNVDILERLTAANIGSGEDEEISVTRVVNELVSHKAD